MVVIQDLPDEDELELIAKASPAAFAIDRNDRIVFWNAGAERFFGIKAKEALGSFCYKVMGGKDLFGNTYCVRDCPIVQAAAAGETNDAFTLEVGPPGGRRQVRIRAVPLPGPGPGFSCLMHLVEENETPELMALVEKLRHHASSAGAVPPDPPISVSPLTTREREILILLANGYAALNIAARLDLSYATVRNHIQSILRKMEVHSQVEAIAVAFRRGWLTA